jgi:hypothetical protein
MNDAQIAIGVSAIALIGQAVNAWLKLKMRADLAEFEGRIVDRIEKRYMPRETFEVELRRVEQACIIRHASN